MVVGGRVETETARLCFGPFVVCADLREEHFHLSACFKMLVRSWRLGAFKCGAGDVVRIDQLFLNSWKCEPHFKHGSFSSRVWGVAGVRASDRAFIKHRSCGAAHVPVFVIDCPSSVG